MQKGWVCLENYVDQSWQELVSTSRTLLGLSQDLKDVLAAADDVLQLVLAASLRIHLYYI